MATPQSQLETSLQISRTFAAPRDRVFHAWTDAKQFAIWFHPTADYTTVITRLDLRVGGAYRLEMHHKDGSVHKLTAGKAGIHLEVAARRRPARITRHRGVPRSGGFHGSEHHACETLQRGGS